MKLTGNYQIRSMAGEWVLMPQGEYLLSENKPIIVNEIVADLVEKIGSGCVDEALYQYCVEEYGIDMDTAKADIGSMLSDLQDKAVIDF